MELGIDDDYNTYFYKYRDFTEQNLRYLENMFLKREIMFSKPAGFNDPFECRPLFRLQGTREELRAHYSAVFDRRGITMNRRSRRKALSDAVVNARRNQSNVSKQARDDRIRTFTNDLGVYCLSKAPDNILMWSHYAANHTGICLEFHGHVDDDFFLTALPVNYQDAYPSVDIVRDDPLEKMKQSILTKSKLWEYEQEFRIVDTRRGPGLQVYPEGALTCVIFGARTKDVDKARVRGWIKQMAKPPKLYQAKIKQDAFGLDIVPIK